MFTLLPSLVTLIKAQSIWAKNKKVMGLKSSQNGKKIAQFGHTDRYAQALE